MRKWIFTDKIHKVPEPAPSPTSTLSISETQIHSVLSIHKYKSHIKLDLRYMAQ